MRVTDKPVKSAGLAPSFDQLKLIAILEVFEVSHELLADFWNEHISSQWDVSGSVGSPFMDRMSTSMLTSISAIVKQFQSIENFAVELSSYLERRDRELAREGGRSKMMGKTNKKMKNLRQPSQNLYIKKFRHYDHTRIRLPFQSRAVIDDDAIDMLGMVIVMVTFIWYCTVTGVLLLDYSYLDYHQDDEDQNHHNSDDADASTGTPQAWTRDHDQRNNWLSMISLEHIYNLFASRATVDSDGLYFLCNIEERLFLAQLLDDMPLNALDRYSFSMAPVQKDCQASVTYFRHYAWMFAKGIPVTLGIDILKPSDVADSMEKLFRFEEIHRVLEIYVWLGHRYPQAFSELNDAISKASQCSQIISDALHSLSFNDSKKYKQRKREKKSPHQRSEEYIDDESEDEFDPENGLQFEISLDKNQDLGQGKSGRNLRFPLGRSGRVGRIKRNRRQLYRW